MGARRVWTGPDVAPAVQAALDAGSNVYVQHAGDKAFVCSQVRVPAGRAAQPCAAKAKNVIYIFLSGGLAQHESFDMKPNAPKEVRGEFNPISTKTPGIQICEHLPELAKRSEQWALCRSLT
ncbi:MAG TPA: DUF1501 domain-containing protein, partial [Bacteroidetes bacterium]|nr:DUF1501 domain-containing protein [Bacteroidota bacterium]